MTKICPDCNGSGSINQTTTRRVWDTRKKRIKIIVEEKKVSCKNCSGWGRI